MNHNKQTNPIVSELDETGVWHTIGEIIAIVFKILFKIIKTLLLIVWGLVSFFLRMAFAFGGSSSRNLSCFEQEEIQRIESEIITGQISATEGELRISQIKDKT
ncbi:MAG: hypothetical protein K0R12_1186 [Gammaproteobacteria bacterium]|nr:hypothetical protein [Gammaproteobacteria bacterium]